jgi:REP element-mobilizing transposase RayT
VNADRPFAIHITWACYGNWLPGDLRGYVSNTLDPKGGFAPKQNIPGTPYTADDGHTYKHARELQKYGTVRLTTDIARAAAEALVEAAAVRQWRILRAAIMANHVHVVITDCPDDGPEVRRVLKGTSQAGMSEKFGKPMRWWTAEGSDRYKHDWQAIDKAVNYVAGQEGILAEIVDMTVEVPRSDSQGERRG